METLVGVGSPTAARPAEVSHPFRMVRADPRLEPEAEVRGRGPRGVYKGSLT